MGDVTQLRVEAGPAVADELAEIYEDSGEDLSNDLDLIILDHPAVEDVIRIVEADET